MNLATFVTILVIACLMVFAIRYLIKNNDHCVGCSACSMKKNGACPHCGAV